MPLSDILGFLKALLIVLVSAAVFGPLAIYVLSPQVYYVADAGSIRVYAKGLDEPVVLHCPRFQVSSSDMTLTGHYLGREREVRGQFVNVIPRGLQTVGPVQIEVLGEGPSGSLVVTIESKDHALIPLAFTHMAVTRLRRNIDVKGKSYAIEVEWHGAVDAASPPLVSVRCNGKPASARLTAWGVF